MGFNSGFKVLTHLTVQISTSFPGNTTAKNSQRSVNLHSATVGKKNARWNVNLPMLATTSDAARLLFVL